MTCVFEVTGEIALQTHAEMGYWHSSQSLRDIAELVILAQWEYPIIAKFLLKIEIEMKIESASTNSEHKVENKSANKSISCSSLQPILRL